MSIYPITKGSRKLVDSIAVEKESTEPRRDFGDSILQMILERQIYTQTDLQHLLECFLNLNATCHHQLIVEAFMATCQHLFPKKKRRTNQIIRTSPSMSPHSIPTSEEPTLLSRFQTLPCTTCISMYITDSGSNQVSLSLQ
ncbi:hypothetical protein VNO78_14001 [Psophocarpus tetragonolobus]|uniref:Transcription repressor n=1 Tax=Psophocarpus tetragonolobus TaxID=3891 RepID=A0AAN9SPP7_PSOTE